MIGKGIHKFCIKYGDSYSEDFKIFIMEKENLFSKTIEDCRLWEHRPIVRDTPARRVMRFNEKVVSPATKEMKWNAKKIEEKEIMANKVYRNRVDILKKYSFFTLVRFWYDNLSKPS